MERMRVWRHQRPHATARSGRRLSDGQTQGRRIHHASATVEGDQRRVRADEAGRLYKMRCGYADGVDE